VRVFRQKSTLEDAIGTHAYSLVQEANMRVTNVILLGSSLSYQLTLVNCVQHCRQGALELARNVHLRVNQLDSSHHTSQDTSMSDMKLASLTAELQQLRRTSAEERHSFESANNEVERLRAALRDAADSYRSVNSHPTLTLTPTLTPI
jgi:hypothetical protein